MPFVLGILDLNKGTVFPAAAVAPAFQFWVPCKSHPSQQYVRGSLLASVAVPFKVNGVLTGILRLLLGKALITGKVLPVAVETPQVFPPPVVM